MFKKLVHLFQSRRRRYCLLWYQREPEEPPALPGLPALDLAKTPIHSGPISVPGTILAEHRAKLGLKTIRLVPMWPDGYCCESNCVGRTNSSDSWLNSTPRPQPHTSFDDTLTALVPETLHNLPRVKALHERHQR